MITFIFLQLGVSVDASIFMDKLENIRMNLSDKSLRVFHIKGPEAIGRDLL